MTRLFASVLVLAATTTWADTGGGSATAEKPAVVADQTAEVATPDDGNTPDEQKLVHGAPLFNPNVAVHIVEAKQFTEQGRHELVLFPVAPQINAKFTEHTGTALQYVYHLHENFGFQVTPQWNWANAESGFNQELLGKTGETAQAATALLLGWAVTGGVEVTPFYGKFAWYEGNLAHYGLVLTGGAGVGATRVTLKPANAAGPETYGDTGSRFVGQVGAGFRVLFGDRFAVRLEVRDLVYTARVDRVNGCDVGDLSILMDTIEKGRDLDSANVSAGCRVETFQGEENGRPRAHDIPLARSTVENASSDVLNLVSFYGGVSFLF